jgi:hypothetical protein
VPLDPQAGRVDADDDLLRRDLCAFDFLKDVLGAPAADGAQPPLAQRGQPPEQLTLEIAAGRRRLRAG